MACGAIESPIRSPALAWTVFGASTVSGLSDAPLTMIRCRSPTKLTLSTIPQSGALPASTIPIVSGRIIATADSQARFAADRLPAAGQHQMAVFDRRFDDVGGADELGDEAAVRREIDLARRADLGDRALAHDDDAVAELHRLGLIVRDIDRGDAERAQQPIELAAQPIAQRGVERGQRLVEQQDARPDRHRARQRHALALAAGELVDPAVLQPRDVGQRHQFGDARGALVRGYAADLQPVADIVGTLMLGNSA